MPCYLLHSSGEPEHVMGSTGPLFGLFAGSHCCGCPAIPPDCGDTLLLFAGLVTEAAINNEAQFLTD
jgi:hypothetical protein